MAAFISGAAYNLLRIAKLSVSEVKAWAQVCKRAFAVDVAATKTIRARCESHSGKRCHDEIRTEPQCWCGTAGFCITLL